MTTDAAEVTALVDNLEAALQSAHAAQVAALEALRGLAKQAKLRPGSEAGDRELEGSDFEDIPTDVGILTVQETAKLLRVSPDVIYDLVKTRQLPALHIGSRIRIGRRGLLAYLCGMNADDFERLIKRRVDDSV